MAKLNLSTVGIPKLTVGIPAPPTHNQRSTTPSLVLPGSHITADLDHNWSQIAIPDPEPYDSAAGSPKVLALQQSVEALQKQLQAALEGIKDLREHVAVLEDRVMELSKDLPFNSEA